MRYQTLRSREVGLHLLLHEDALANLPDKIRQLGPWQGAKRGDIDRLKPHYRALLAEQGFVVVYTERAVFNPES